MQDKTIGELNLFTVNLAGNRTYSYVVYDGLSSVTADYALPPRQVTAGFYYKF